MTVDRKAVREALEKASPLPWQVAFHLATPNSLQVDCLAAGKMHRIASLGGNKNEDANAHLIANAPTWLAGLLTEVEHLESHMDLLIEQRHAAEARVKWLEATIDVMGDLPVMLDPEGGIKVADQSAEVARLQERVRELETTLNGAREALAQCHCGLYTARTALAAIDAAIQSTQPKESMKGCEP